MITEREIQTDRLDAALAEFHNRGGEVQQVAGFTPQPRPARKDWIDPETVLNRKFQDALSRRERKRIRRMADSL